MCLVGLHSVMFEAAQVLTLCVLLTDEVIPGVFRVATGLVGLLDDCAATADVDDNVSANVLVTTGKYDDACLVGSNAEIMLKAGQVATLCVLLTDEVTAGVFTLATGLVGLLGDCRSTDTADADGNVSADLLVTTGEYNDGCLVGSHVAVTFEAAQVVTLRVLLTDEVTPGVFRVATGLVDLVNDCAATADVDNGLCID